MDNLSKNLSWREYYFQGIKVNPEETYLFDKSLSEITGASSSNFCGFVEIYVGEHESLSHNIQCLKFYHCYASSPVKYDEFGMKSGMIEIEKDKSTSQPRIKVKRIANAGYLKVLVRVYTSGS